MTECELLEARILISSPSEYRLHQDVWRLYGGEKGNDKKRDYLYSFRKSSHGMLVVVRTSTDNNASDLFKEHLVPKTYAFSTGQHFRFSIRTNAIMRSDNKTYAVPMNDEAKPWFERKALQHGFSCVVDDAWSRPMSFYGSGRRKITLNNTVLNGTLCVEDESAFQSSLILGIGRQKGFGFGMLQLSSMENTHVQ